MNYLNQTLWDKANIDNGVIQRYSINIFNKIETCMEEIKTKSINNYFDLLIF